MGARRSHAAIELVAFDCDGVLVDSEPLVNRVFVELVARDGPTLDLEASLERFTGVSLRARVDAVRAELGWTPASDFIVVFAQCLETAAQRELRAVAGVEDVLRRIALPWCVVSNGSRVEMTMRIGCAGIAVPQDRLFSATEVARPKPHPDVYLHAAAEMKTDPSACVAVEDSVPGASAAVAAGMTVLGYAPRGDGVALAAVGARVFSEMRQLSALIDRVIGEHERGVTGR